MISSAGKGLLLEVMVYLLVVRVGSKGCGFSDASDSCKCTHCRTGVESCLANLHGQFKLHISAHVYVSDDARSSSFVSYLSTVQESTVCLHLLMVM